MYRNRKCLVDLLVLLMVAMMIVFIKYYTSEAFFSLELLISRVSNSKRVLSFSEFTVEVATGGLHAQVLLQLESSLLTLSTS
jgi:hypothetical protein